uniref:Uncharacterized protein n=1 Tax=Panagrolaimus sp. PS1159 TaxID=55785 RepID=A0AC35GQG2_9BILA
MSKSELCYPPFKAKIELFDHSTIFPDTLLDSLTINKSDKYSFTWTDHRFFVVDPILKIFVECFDGTIFEQDYDFTHLESQPKIISQNVKVTMKYE